MRKYLSLIASLFICVFFIGILLFLLLEVVQIKDFDTFAPILVFSIINFLAIICIIGLGKMILESIGVGLYAPVVIITFMYTIIHLLVLFFLYRATPSRYLLVQLIVLFVYCATTIPLLVKGFSLKPAQKE